MNTQRGATPPTVSELHRLEAQLHERQERLALVVEAAALGTWELDAATGAFQWDDSCKAILGLPLEAEGERARLLAAVHPDDRALVDQAVARALDPASGGVLHVEFRLASSAAGAPGERWVSTRGRARFQTDQQAARLLGVMVDITARKQVEAERAALLHRAEAAREEAEAAGRLKDEFLTTVSHELRTPLTSMLGWAHVLRATSPSPELLARGLATIERNGKAQARLIDDLLDASRIVVGSLRLDVQEVDLATLLDRALDTAQLAADEKGVRIEAQPGPRPVLVHGDPARLTQILCNLTHNAVKFTPRGGTVRVRLVPLGATVELVVTDTGKGIAPAFLPHVFERFRQEDGSHTRAHGGLGLGLAIVRYLTELHGGTVQALSEGEGRGATFVLRLPLPPLREDSAEVRATPPPPPPGASEPTVGPVLEGIHLLLVDDDQDTSDLLALLLKRSGAEVTTVSSAADALAALPHLRPDVLISDIGMPDQDGFALIRSVRALPPGAGRDTPAVALTAHAHDEMRRQALDAGFDRFLSKPIKPAELIAAALSLAQDARSRRASRAPRA